jgi:hypothetical protein
MDQKEKQKECTSSKVEGKRKMQFYAPLFLSKGKPCTGKDL